MITTKKVPVQTVSVYVLGPHSHCEVNSPVGRAITELIKEAEAFAANFPDVPEAEGLIKTMVQEQAKTWYMS